MKTINFLTGNFIPENCAGTNRVLSLVKSLEKKYKINLICITEKGKPQKNSKIRFSENVDVYYIDQKYYNGEKFYTRALCELYYSIKLATKSNSLLSDITIATSPQMFIIPSVALIVRGKKIIDVRDLVWEYIEETSLYRKMIKKAITQLMKLTLKQYDNITATNDLEIKWIKSSVKKVNTSKVTNGIDESTFLKLNALEYRSNNKFIVTYIGNVGIAQNIKTLIDAAKDLKNIHINIVGDGNRYQYLKSYVHKNRIFNVEFFGKVSREKMVDFYQESSVLFAQLDETFKVAMPSKLYEYSSTGLPIIYAGLGIARDFIDSLENCTTIDPGDTIALKSAIVKYSNSKLLISSKNRELIRENFIREIQSLKMIDLVDKLI